jgi:hypothetical protein
MKSRNEIVQKLESPKGSLPSANYQNVKQDNEYRSSNPIEY